MSYVSQDKTRSILSISLVAILLINIPVAWGLDAGEKQIELNSHGYLKRSDDVDILYVTGSYYEMGFQHGDLLAEEIKQNSRAYLHYAKQQGLTYDKLLKLWNITQHYTPLEIIQELQGVAEGADISFEKIALVNIIPMRFHCCGIAAWGNATSDNQLYHTRSLDYPLDIQDPETGVYLQQNQIMIVRQPDNGYASLQPGFAGFVGSLGGINTEGVGLGQMSSWCSDETDYGTPMTFRLKLVLDHAATTTEAITYITTNSTCGYNYIVSDADEHTGYAVETTAHYSYAGTWDNPVESTPPCWSIPAVVRRTNFFINPTTASTQRDRYDPSSLLLFLIGYNPDFPYWHHYNTLSNGIEDTWGAMNLNTTISMLRDVYNGRTNILMFIAQRIGLLRTMHQWVACPETGEMIITFASVEKSAFKNQLHYFNLKKLV